MADEDAFTTDENGRRYRRYDFIKTKPIPRLDFRSKEIDGIIKRQEPVIITNSELVDSASKWDLDYLTEHLGQDYKTVYFSDTHKFKYFNEGRCANYPDFKPPMIPRDLPFEVFADLFRRWKPGDQYIYFQQALTSSVGPQIMEDFKQFRWDWLASKQEMFDWGDLTSNLMLIGLPGNITPVHYDEQQNFFAQVHGYKRVLMFNPKYFQCLYPYPFHHPCDRQSQVDFESPDFGKFPLLKHLHGYEEVVGPGDVLYIPIHWWHYIESTMDSKITTSVNFWYKHTTLSLRDLTFPLKWQQKLTIARNIEKMLGEALGSPSEVGPFLKALVDGRYDVPDLKADDFDF